MAAPVHPTYQDEAVIVLNVRNAEEEEIPERRVLLSKTSPIVNVGRMSTQKIALHSAVNNFWFNCPVVSRHHAQIKFDLDKKKLFIKDTGSLHGTSLNSVRLQAGVYWPLDTGDSITLGVQVDRGEFTHRPYELLVNIMLGTAQYNQDPKVYRVPDDSESEDVGNEKYDALEYASNTLLRHQIAPSSHRLSPIDLTSPSPVIDLSSVNEPDTDLDSGPEVEPESTAPFHGRTSSTCPEDEVEEGHAHHEPRGPSADMAHKQPIVVEASHASAEQGLNESDAEACHDFAQQHLDESDADEYDDDCECQSILSDESDVDEEDARSLSADGSESASDEGEEMQISTDTTIQHDSITTTITSSLVNEHQVPTAATEFPLSPPNVAPHIEPLPQIDSDYIPPLCTHPASIPPRTLRETFASAFGPRCQVSQEMVRNSDASTLLRSPWPMGELRPWQQPREMTFVQSPPPTIPSDQNHWTLDQCDEPASLCDESAYEFNKSKKLAEETLLSHRTPAIAPKELAPNTEAKAMSCDYSDPTKSHTLMPPHQVDPKKIMLSPQKPEDTVMKSIKKIPKMPGNLESIQTHEVKPAEAIEMPIQVPVKEPAKIASPVTASTPISDAAPVESPVPSSTKRKANEISDLVPEESETAAGNTTLPYHTQKTQLPSVQRPAKFQRVAEVIGYAALGGLAVMGGLIATAPSL